MNQKNPEPPKHSRLLSRLSESRYFTISLLLHVILLIVAGTIILVQQKSEPFAGIEGTVPTNDDPPPTDPVPKTEQPPEPKLTQQKPEEAVKNVVEPKAPPVETPAIKVTLPLMALTDKSPIKVKVETPGTSPQIMPGAVAPEMSLRFEKDGNGHISTTHWPAGAPRMPQGSENAVVRGLRWLRDHQNEDGSWGEKNKAAMTGLGLLCFLGHGELTDSPEYGLTVNRAVQWIVDHGTLAKGRLSMTDGDWGPGNSGVYEHAIATYALGEYFTMSKDERVKELLAQAVAYIVDGQGPDGGWMYHYDKTPSDTSVSGWQVQALKAAHLTKLNLPGVDAALDRAMKNFDRVQGPNGGYGYRGPEDRYSLTGVGVLSELFWRGTRNKDLRKSVEFITEKSQKEFPVRYQGEKGDLYAWYYNGQAMLMYGGAAWTNWDHRFSAELIQSQSGEGDWPPMRAPGVGNLQDAQSLTGQIYRTSLCVLMLEVYYRYMPIHQSEAGIALPKVAAR